MQGSFCGAVVAVRPHRSALDSVSTSIKAPLVWGLELICKNLLRLQELGKQGVCSGVWSFFFLFPLPVVKKNIVRLLFKHLVTDV